MPHSDPSNLHGPTANDSIEKILIGCLDRPQDEWAGSIQEACRAHPTLAERLRRRFSRIQHLGLLEGAEADEITPDSIGPYTITDRLGSGGMGTVWLAEQEEPLARRVAIKVIKGGMESKTALVRFQLERHALARMNHSNIAKIFDAGVIHGQRPYFVMEFVEGEAITQYCKRNKLGLRARLELLIKVCEGVQHAHQRGILHRDLKPSNILVTDQEGHAVPKIIDFGVARTIGEPLLSRSLVTQRGFLVGTPEYMSPEQAAGAVEDLDTRTDVYSLGVLLYELLVGTVPFQPPESGNGDLLELLRLVREDDPPRPSAQVKTRTRASQAVARERGTDLTSLQRILRRELDWIVLKALEKNRSRRYATALEFAADIERYLNHEPLVAHAPTKSYRFRKFLRRHRGSVAAAVAIFLALGTGLVMSLRFAGKAQSAAEVAELATVEARKQALLARKRSEAVNGIAGSIVVRFSALLKDIPGTMVVRGHLVTESLRFLRVMEDVQDQSPFSIYTLASAYLAVGKLQGVPLDQNLGDLKSALVSIKKVLELASELKELKIDPKLATRIRLMHADARLCLALILKAQVKDSQALTHLSKGRMLLEPLHANQQLTNDGIIILGKLLRVQAWIIAGMGQIEESIEMARKSLTVLDSWSGEKHSGYQVLRIATLDDIKDRLMDAKRFDEAADLLADNEKQLRLFKKGRPEHLPITTMLRNTLRSQVDIYKCKHEWEKCVTPQREVVALSRSMLRQDPSDYSMRFDLMHDLSVLGFYTSYQRMPEGHDHFGEAQWMLEGLQEMGPIARRYRKWACAHLTNYAFHLAVQDRKPEKGLRMLQAAQEFLQKIHAHRSTYSSKSRLADNLRHIGAVQHDLGQHKESLATLERSEKLYRELLLDPKRPQGVATPRKWIGFILRDSGRALAALGRISEAKIKHTLAGDMWKKLGHEFPEDGAFLSRQITSIKEILALDKEAPERRRRSAWKRVLEIRKEAATRKQAGMYDLLLAAVDNMDCPVEDLRDLAFAEKCAALVVKIIPEDDKSPKRAHIRADMQERLERLRKR